MTLYKFFNLISGFILLGYNLSLFREKLNFPGRRSAALMARFQHSARPDRLTVLLSGVTFWAFAELTVLSVIQYAPALFLNTVVGDLFHTGSNYFGLLFAGPFFLLLFCFLWRIDPLRQMDLLTPAYPLALSVSKIACFSAGCCGGITVSFRLLRSHPISGTFPSQLLESVLALLIFFLLLHWKETLPAGSLFPVYLILYSGIRFFSEFLRHEAPVCGILRTYQLFCIAGVLFGLLELFFVLKFGKQLRSLCTKYPADVSPS